ncbi:MAG TPA: NADH:ubiquinone oxidoreductase subunit NDUFA12 [Stellaceae bacterium]|jgi:NADH:ubiquinone oxidoreductase subunit
MTIGTRLMTWLRGEPVGTDSFGNRYYRDKSQRKLQQGGGRFSREKRWVLYKGVPEASGVPPQWHAWLHHTVDAVPQEGQPQHAWQKPHLPNLTGTPDAYRPPGSLFRGGHRAAAAGDYEPWKPE